MDGDIRDLIAIEQGATNFNGGLPVEDNEDYSEYCEHCGGALEEEQEERGTRLCEACEEEERREIWNRLPNAQKEALIREAGR